MKLTLPGDRGNLYLSVLAANLASTSIGTHYTWTSPTLPALRQADSWLKITEDEGAWLASLPPLGTVFGPFLGGWLVDTIGRRKTIMTSVALSLIAWIVVLFSNNLWEIYVGRFMGGVGGGIAFLACPMYVAEISERLLRGALGSLFAFFLVGGYLLEYIVGPYVGYTALIIINMVPSVLFFLLIVMAPESPYYFLRNEDSAGAFESLVWLRKGRSQDEVQSELNEMQTEVRKSMKEKGSFKDLFATRGNRMGFFISCGTFTGQQVSGVNVMLFYTQTIFLMAGVSFSASISTIITGLILFLFRGFTPPLVRTFGMKNVLIVSSIGMCIFQCILGVYFYLNSIITDFAFEWVPIVSMMGYILLLTVGLGPLPWAVNAEMFPPNVKAVGSSLAASYNWFISFLLTRFFSKIAAVLGSHVPFFLFAVGCIYALIFTIVFLPDTRGLTLQEISDVLNKRPVEKSREKN